MDDKRARSLSTRLIKILLSCAAVAIFVTAVAAGPKEVVRPEDLKEAPCLSATGPCVLREAPGGRVPEHLEQGRRFLREGRRVVVDGVCASACTMMIQENRVNTCVTRRAMLGYHKILNEYSDGWVGQHDHKFDQDVAEWLKEAGGTPRQPGVIYMPNEVARKIYGECK